MVRQVDDRRESRRLEKQPLGREGKDRISTKSGDLLDHEWLIRRQFSMMRDVQSRFGKRLVSRRVMGRSRCRLEAFVDAKCIRLRLPQYERVQSTIDVEVG